MRTDINKIEKKETCNEETQKARRWFFGITNKIAKFLARLVKEKKTKPSEIKKEAYCRFNRH